MKKVLLILCVAFLSLSAIYSCKTAKSAENDSSESPYLCIAYVWEDDGPLPKADLVTTINFLAASPNSEHNGVYIHNEPRLRSLLELKNENPDLKVVLSMGGADATAGWAEMLADESLRKAFVADCVRLIDLYGLDGFDFDWEFPSNDAERANYVTLFKELREAVGTDKLVTAAAGFGGYGFDLKEAMNYLDYINLMSYDMGWQAPYHHTALRRSELAGVCTIEETVDSCLKKGINYNDIVLGLAFYGRGDNDNFKSWTDYREIAPREGMEERWDSIACVPYIVDSEGRLIIGYDNPRSLKIKCDYIKEKGLRGGMYWRAELDNENLDLTRTVARELMGK